MRQCYIFTEHMAILHEKQYMMFTVSCANKTPPFILRIFLASQTADISQSRGIINHHWHSNFPFSLSFVMLICENCLLKMMLQNMIYQNSLENGGQVPLLSNAFLSTKLEAAGRQTVSETSSCNHATILSNTGLVSSLMTHSYQCILWYWSKHCTNVDRVQLGDGPKKT